MNNKKKELLDKPKESIPNPGISSNKNYNLKFEGLASNIPELSHSYIIEEKPYENNIPNTNNQRKSFNMNDNGNINNPNNNFKQKNYNNIAENNGKKEELDIEIKDFFNNNKDIIQESAYKHNAEQKKPKPISIFKDMEFEYEDFEEQFQKKPVNAITHKKEKLVRNNGNIDYLNAKTNKNEVSMNLKNKIENKNGNNSILINNNVINDNNKNNEIILGNFDSNPDLTNQVFSNEIKINHHKKQGNDNNNGNSSFVQDLIEDW